MRSIIKTVTYLILDLLTHSFIVYFAGQFFGYQISISSAGGVGALIELFETIAYYVHERIWERVPIKQDKKNTIRVVGETNKDLRRVNVSRKKDSQSRRLRK